jgi:hypothetical protein
MEAAKEETASSFKRWTASRKKEVVLRILRGESLDALSREIGVEIYILEEWRDTVLGGIDILLKSRQDNPLQEELDHAKRRIGELTMEVELLTIRAKRASPFRMGRSRK